MTKLNVSQMRRDIDAEIVRASDVESDLSDKVSRISETLGSVKTLSENNASSINATNTIATAASTKVNTLESVVNTLESTVGTMQNELDNKFPTFDGIEIPANADLDNYTTAGVYHTTSDANSASLSNCPTTAVFTMLVYGCYADGYKRVVQEITVANVSTNTTGVRFIRHLNTAGVWQSWKCIGGYANLYMSDTKGFTSSSTTCNLARSILSFNNITIVLRPSADSNAPGGQRYSFTIPVRDIVRAINDSTAYGNQLELSLFENASTYISIIVSFNEAGTVMTFRRNRYEAWTVCYVSSIVGF